MKMGKFFTLVACTIGIVFTVSAQQTGQTQPYQKGIGLRIAPGSYYDVAAVSYKFFITDPGAIELNAGFGLKGYGPYYVGANYYGSSKPFNLSISAAYQHHFEIPVKNGGLYWFIGGGLVGYRSFSSDGQFDGFGFGLFPTGGVDYKIPNTSLSVSADYRPTFLLTRPDYYDSFYGSNFGLSARFVFGGK